MFCFFSSRRRHTRYWRDWSSDVCSSDLIFIDASWWGLKLLAGVLSIIAGLFVLEHPLWSTVMVPSVLVFVVGFLSIFQGAAGVVGALQGGGGGVGILSVLGLLFGLILVIYPLIRVGAVPLVLGVFMLVGGIGGD